MEKDAQKYRERPETKNVIALIAAFLLPPYHHSFSIGRYHPVKGKNLEPYKVITHSGFAAIITVAIPAIESFEGQRFIVGDFFDEPTFASNFPDVNSSALLNGLRIVMNHSLFKFNGRTFLQLSGCAMGTPPAPPYVTLYFYLHERTILPACSSCTFYTRYINDVFGIWVPTNPLTDTADWNDFTSSIDTYGKLRWDFAPKSRSVVFLDLRISIDDNGDITTDLFEKKLNLHLYLPPASMHPPGVLKGLVKGSLFRIDTLCASPERRVHHKMMFFKRLYRRGYRPATILPLLRHHNKKSLSSRSTERPIFLHCDFTPSTHWKIPRSTFSSTIEFPPSEPPFSALRNRFNLPLDPTRLILAYHRLPNLRNLLCARKFRHEPLPPPPPHVPAHGHDISRGENPGPPRGSTSALLLSSRDPPASPWHPPVPPTDEAKAKQVT